jgi:hypothetical protein
MVGPGLLMVVGGGGVMVVGVGTMLGGVGFEFNATSRQLPINIQTNQQGPELTGTGNKGGPELTGTVINGDWNKRRPE